MERLSCAVLPTSCSKAISCPWWHRVQESIGWSLYLLKPWRDHDTTLKRDAILSKEEILTRGFSCSEDWKIKNDVPQTRNECKKIFYLETSEDKGVAINLNLSMVGLGGRNHRAFFTKQLNEYAESGTMLKGLWLITVEAHLVFVWTLDSSYSQISHSSKFPTTSLI